MSQAAEAQRRRNMAKHWNAKQAEATTQPQRVAVWYDAARTVAVGAAKDGDQTVWAALEEALHDFYRKHAR